MFLLGFRVLGDAPKSADDDVQSMFEGWKATFEWIVDRERRAQKTVVFRTLAPPSGFGAKSRLSGRRSNRVFRTPRQGVASCPDPYP